ncbi:MAG: hypothetical protein HYY26_00690 [Acidobacteria bacterium]|nr:hypothetical protein [Acidobacteriota bacterium]
MTNNEQEYREGLELYARAQRLLATLRDSVGFELAEGTRQRFLRLHHVINATPRLPILERLVPTRDLHRHWLRIFTDSAIGYTQEGLAACYYHLNNLGSLESEMVTLVVSHVDELRLQPGQVMAVGNTRRLDFEYQAFVLAVRRTLEYFAVSVGAFFKREAHRIRGLADSIRGSEPEEISTRAITRLNASLNQIAYVLPLAEQMTTIRDQLAHWRPVPAGTLNITRGPDRIYVGLLGGGQNLRLWNSEVEVRPTLREENGVVIGLLSPLLADELTRVEDFMFSVYADMGLA